MAQPAKEEKLKELIDWMEAFNLSAKEASKQLGVAEEILVAVQNGKAMPRAMWNELKTRFDYKQCLPDKAPGKQVEREKKKEEILDANLTNAVTLNKTQLTFSFTADISILRQVCTRWAIKHPEFKQRDLIATVEAMLQETFS